MMQQPLQGLIPKQTIEVTAYHDESGGTGKHEHYLFQGVLFVPHQHRTAILVEMKKARQGYNGLIHFADLREKHQHKVDIAQRWLELFVGWMCQHAFYNCLVVDTKSNYYKRRWAEKQFYPYNHSVAIAVFSGINWFYYNCDNLRMAIMSEEKTRSADDNFVDYVALRVRERAYEKWMRKGKCPQVELTRPQVGLIDGTVPSEECEFIQLTDVLTGCVAQAVNASSSKEVKNKLGNIVADWMRDIELPPWKQRHKLHRRFSVQCYPDEAGSFYTCPQLIKDMAAEQQQPKLL